MEQTATADPDMEKGVDFEKEESVENVSRNASTAATAAGGGTIPQIILKHGQDADEAMKAFAQGEAIDLAIDEATNKRLLRRIDLNLMPLLCVVYCLNYLDKTALSYASIMGIKDDINLVGQDYSWLSSIFYFGYLGWEWPTNFLLQRLPLGKYSALNVILWGATLSCFAGVSSYSGAIAVRFFLGIFEAAVTPGFALFTSQWYTKKEQGARMGIWFSFNGFAQIFGGLIAYAIDVGTTRYGSSIAPWKIVFLVTGLVTLSVGIIFMILMPDNQLNARFLSKKDQILAIERIRSNEQGIGNKHWKYYQFKEALIDPMSWMIVAYAFVADIPNGGISNFFSQLIVSFGYTKSESLLYGTPGGAVEVVSLISWGLLTYRYANMRILLSSMWLLVAILGIILIVALPLDNNGGRLAGFYLTQASAVPFVCLLSLISTNVAGYTKKTTVAAMYLIAYCTGNIIGPQTFQSADAPRYVPAEITIIVCWGVCFADLMLIYTYCRWQNRKKAAARASPDYVKLNNQEFLDLTDKENLELVYSL